MYKRITLAVLASTLALMTTDMASAKNAPSPIALLMKHKPHQSGSQANHRSLKKLNLSLTKAECIEIERSLTDAYGPASRTRGNKRIWEVENSNKSSGQSKIITIIAGEENGRYFAKLDRNGFAASNNPRLRKNKRPNSLSRPQNQTKRHKSMSVHKSYERD